ncbi:hypothetical protein [Defluviimonas sp. SAOS-178_SWC]|uniref:hypothetical protein n=1 Tax=Defluviimonas sp. SAOS-178_SWC TaxID=3121287 RepID=UPI0032220C75
MARKFSAAVLNAMLDTYETQIGTAPTLEIRTGAAPANAAAADTGTVLATITLPSDWMSAASGAVKSLIGTWQDASADATGTAGHFRLKQGGTCHDQGSITATSGGGDMEVDNTSLAAGQQFTVTSWALNLAAYL